MAKLAIILAIVVAFLATAAFALNDAQLRSQFNEFIVQQTRKYKTAEEFEFRYQVFKTNSETAARLTAESKTAEFSAMNQFGDWTEEERKNWLGRLPTAPQRQKQVKTLAKQSPKASSGAPSFSLTKKGVVAPVVNQGSCGSCWAFSTTEGVMSAAKVQGYPEAFNLSPQVLVDCDKEDGGCDGGDLPSAFDALVQLGGYMTLDDYPYTARDGSCKFNSSKIAVPVTGFEWAIPTCEYSNCDKQDIDQFLTNVGDRGVASSICVYVNDAFMYYKSGIYDSTCSSRYNVLNHCVLLTDYSKEEGYVNIKNSWGLSWGEQGFIRISTTKPNEPNLCGWADEATFANVPARK